jgi:iron complex outermembrane receptor protein
MVCCGCRGGETLEGQLGISASYFGTGASRPIIRGLAGARVRTMEDGIDSMDISSVSVDHAVSIDPLVAKQIEVFRGPTTLLYGSGAVGGVINTVTNRIPEYAPEDGFDAAFELRGDTVSSERTGAFALDGGGDSFAWHIDAASRNTDDYEVPGFAEHTHDGEPIDSAGLDRELGGRARVLTPAAPDRRGCALAVQFAPPPADPLSFVARLRAAGVVADWRKPNVLRLAPVPLYNRYRDVYGAVQALRRTLES